MRTWPVRHSFWIAPLRQAGKVAAEPAVQADVGFVVGDRTRGNSSPPPLLAGGGCGEGKHLHHNGIASKVSILSLSSTTIALVEPEGGGEMSIRSR